MELINSHAYDADAARVRAIAPLVDDALNAIEWELLAVDATRLGRYLSFQIAGRPGTYFIHQSVPLPPGTARVLVIFEIEKHNGTDKLLLLGANYL